ncbi:hypothetical protein [Burkholderia ambifaria]|uniref:hypothetical protein n=1 Tax=Burkholderia ambifaria TaxID=152480 RepID=UPI00158E7035|nr:hypothetical protein [Burkholderia ambifaria]
MQQATNQQIALERGGANCTDTGHFAQPAHKVDDCRCDLQKAQDAVREVETDLHVADMHGDVRKLAAK